MGIHPLLLALVCLTLASTCLAFGAGNIPSFAYLEGKAFRHGDLEDTLKELLKSTGGFLGRGSKFGGLDSKMTELTIRPRLIDRSQARLHGQLAARLLAGDGHRRAQEAVQANHPQLDHGAWVPSA